MNEENKIIDLKLTMDNAPGPMNRKSTIAKLIGRDPSTIFNYYNGETIPKAANILLIEIFKKNDCKIFFR